jgi:hypothetical protein
MSVKPERADKLSQVVRDICVRHNFLSEQCILLGSGKFSVNLLGERHNAMGIQANTKFPKSRTSPPIPQLRIPGDEAHLSNRRYT